MLCGPKGSEQRSRLQCGVCGATGNCLSSPDTDRLCLSCGADLAISEQVTIEIDAAALSGRETENLLAEFTQLSQRSSNERNPFSLQITEPPKVASSLFDPRVPPAHGIADRYYREPDEVNHRKAEAIVRWKNFARTAQRRWWQQ